MNTQDPPDESLPPWGRQPNPETDVPQVKWIGRTCDRLSRWKEGLETLDHQCPLPLNLFRFVVVAYQFESAWGVFIACGLNSYIAWSLHILHGDLSADVPRIDSCGNLADPLKCQRALRDFENSLFCWAAAGTNPAEDWNQITAVPGVYWRQSTQPGAPARWAQNWSGWETGIKAAQVNLTTNLTANVDTLPGIFERLKGRASPPGAPPEPRMKGSTLIGGASTKHKRVDNDFYPTPPECTRALLTAFPELVAPGRAVWEPAAGDGAICKVLKEYGARVVASDLVDRGYPGTVLMDFLNAPEQVDNLGAIITNPPFNLAEPFIAKCLRYGIPFAILHKATYWHAKSRFPLFRASGPLAVAPLLWRPVMAAERGKSPTMDFAWTVWGAEPAATTRYVPLPKP